MAAAGQIEEAVTFSRGVAAKYRATASAAVGKLIAINQEPVSYTHLDVYKRQQHASPCPDGRLQERHPFCFI